MPVAVAFSTRPTLLLSDASPLTLADRERGMAFRACRVAVPLEVAVRLNPTRLLKETGALEAALKPSLTERISVATPVAAAERLIGTERSSEAVPDEAAESPISMSPTTVRRALPALVAARLFCIVRTSSGVPEPVARIRRCTVLLRAAAPLPAALTLKPILRRNEATALEVA